MGKAADYLTNYLNTNIDFRGQAGLPAISAIKDAEYKARAATDVGIPTPNTDATTGDPYLDAAARNAGSGQYSNDTTAFRTSNEAMGDHVTDVINGVVQGFTGLGSLGVGLVSDKGGAAVAGFGQSANDYADYLHSDALGSHQAAVAARNALTSERNRALAVKDKEAGFSDLMTGLRRVGRDALDSVSNGDSMSRESAIANGLGSFAVGGVVGKGLKALGLGSRAAMGISIGAQEGGGAHEQTVNAVMSMSHDELMQGSQEYRNLINAGQSPEDARAAIANHAGLMAAAIAAPVGAATGAAFSAGEHALFSVPNLRAAVAKPFVEAGEEFVQSGTGQYGQNVGVKNYANDQQDLLDGVGQAAGEGALAGFGTGAIMGAPGGAKQAVLSTARTVRNSIVNRVNNINAARDATSPVAAEQVAPVYASVLDQVSNPDVRTNVESALADRPEQSPAILDHFDKLKASITLDPTEADRATSPLIADALRGSTDKFDALRKVAAIAADESLPIAERVHAGMYLHNVQTQDHSLVTSLVEAIHATDEKDPRLAPLTEMEDVLLSLTQVPEISKAISLGSQLAAKLDAKNVAPDKINTPEGQSTVQAAAAAAEINPLGGNLDVVNGVLQHAKAAGINLTEQQRTALIASSELLTAAKEHADKILAGGLKKSIDAVSGEIRSDGIDGKQLSASQHTQRIMQAMANGDLETAGGALANFMNFATHMQNKVEALNKHLELQNKEGQFYPSLGGDGEFNRSKTPLMVHPSKDGSINLAQSIANDARVVATMANTMAKAYPALGIKPVELVNLDNRLVGNIKDVAYKFRAAKAANATVEKTETKPIVVDPPVTEVPATKRQSDAPAADEKMSPGQELGNRIRETQTDDKGVWIGLSDEAAKLSEDELGSMLETIDELTGVKPVAGDLKTRVASTFADLAKLTGVDMSTLVRGIYVRDAKGTSSALYHFVGNAITLGRDYIATLNGDPARLARAVSHELGHALDWFSTEQGLASNDPMFDQNGDLFVEFSKLKQKDTLPPWVSEPLWQYINDSFKDSNEEFFAELASFVMLNPELAQELIPNGAAVIQEILGEVAQIRNLPSGIGREAGPATGPADGGNAEAKAAGEGEVAGEQDPAPAQRNVVQAKAEPTPAVKADAPAPVVKAEPVKPVEAPAPVEKPVEEKPAAEAEPAVDETPAAPDLTVDPFADLIDANEAGTVNWFKKTYSLVPGASRIITLGDGLMDAVRRGLSSTANFIQFAGKSSISGTIDQAVAAAYDSILGAVDTIAENMNARLEANLNKPIGSKDTLTFGQGLVFGGNLRSLTDMMRTKVFNTLDQKGETIGYNQPIQQSSILAGLQWLVGQNQTGRMLDDESVLKLLGVRSEDQVLDSLDDLKLRFNDGIDEEFAVRAVAETVKKFWGIRESKDAYVGMADGIPAAMAAEVLAAFEKAGLIERYSEKVNFPDGPKDFNRIRITAPKDTLAAARQKPDLIERLVLSKPDTVWHIGSPPAEDSASTTQLRNRSVQNSAQQQQMIKHYGNTGYKPVMIMHAFYSMLGENALKLFGSGPIADGTNVNHRMSLEGKNQTILSAISTMNEVMAGVENFAKANGMDVKDVPVHYRHVITKSARLQMQGKNTPQASKFIRELLSPVRSVADLSGADPKASSVFMLALAQHLGEKVHKVNRSMVEEKIFNRLNDPKDLAPAVKVIRDWVSDQGSKKPRPLDDGDLAVLTKALGEGMEPVAVHALIEYARYLNAVDAGGDALSNFETSMYVEADGISDGPINAMILFGLGVLKDGGFHPWFTDKWIQVMAKGGMFLGSKRMSIADYMMSGEEGADADTYEATTEAFRALRAAHINGAPDEVRKMSDHLMTLMSELTGGDITIEDGVMTIKRGIAKNPVTVTIYGSGANGITSKFIRLLSQEIYKQLSTPEGMSQGASDALRALTSSYVVLSKKGTWHQFAAEGSTDVFKTKGSDASTMTLTPQAIENLGKNISSMFVAPLMKAIDNTIGEVTPAMKALQQATQVQSIIKADMFQKRVDALVAEKEADAKLPEADRKWPGWKKAFSLSRGELETIETELNKLFPQIDTGTQAYDFSGSEYLKTGSDAAHGLENDYKVPLTVRGPVNAGVRAQSGLVQGTGDGSMIQNFAVTPNAPPSVPVFDGINFGVNDVETGSEMINKAVFDGWMKNPLGDVTRAHNEFMKNITPEILEGLSANSKQDLARAFNYESVEFLNTASDLSGLGERLSLMSQFLAARSSVLSSVAMSVDHMASAESPHVNEGIELVGTMEEKRIQLNALLKTELERRGVKASDIEQLMQSEDPTKELPADGTPEAPVRKTASERITEQVDLLNANEHAVIAQAYGETELNDTAREKFEADVILTVDGRPIVSRSTKLKNLIRKVILGLSALSVVFSMAGLQPAALTSQASASVSVAQASTVPADAKANMSSFSQRVYETLAPAALKTGKGFIIADKPAGMIHVFGKDGQLIVSSAALYGKVAGDDVQRAGMNGLVTPAGKYEIKFEDSDYKGGKIARLYLPGSKDGGQLGGVAIHSVYMGNVSENRIGRLGSADASDNKISHGCINTSEQTFVQKIVPNTAQLNGATVFVVSENSDNVAQLGEEPIVKSPPLTQKNQLPARNDDPTQGMGLAGLGLLAVRRKSGSSTDATSSELISRPLPAAMVDHQSPEFGNNDRLTRVRRALRDKVAQHLVKFTGGEAITEETKVALASNKAGAVASQMIATGFPNMTMQERTTFEMVVQTLATQAHLDPNSLARMSQLWDHVVTHLDRKDFLENKQDPDQPDLTQAQNKLDSILGNYGVQIDEQGRSSLMPAFMALAIVNDQFREILRGMPLPKSEKNSAGTLDAVLDNFGTKSMDNLNRAMSGEGRSQNVREAIDNLTDRMAASDAEAESFVRSLSNSTTGVIGRANDWIVEKVDALALKAETHMNEKKLTATHPAAKLLLAMGTTLTSLVNEERSELLTQSLMSQANRLNLPKMLFDFFNEMAGRTEDNAPIYDMIKLVRSLVQKIRQQFRIQLPKTVAKKFTRKLTKPEYKAVHDGFAKPDLAALAGTYSPQQILDIVNDDALAARELKKLEEQIQKNTKAMPLVKQKMEELARSMITGEKVSANGNFLSNAEAIARLLNEHQHALAAGIVPSEAHVRAIDQYTTLLALSQISAPTKATVKNLMLTERHGLEFVLTSLIGQSLGERAKFNSDLNPRAMLNHYKGHVPTESQTGTSLIVALDSEASRLRTLGYERVADYKGSRAEGAVQKKGYYFAPVSGRAAFHQGILQTVRQTAFGVDPRTGFTNGPMVADRITDPVLVKAIRQRAEKLNTGPEGLLPVFNEHYKVIAYERAVAPAQEARLGYNTHIGEVLGIWRGRQMEEILSQSMNQSLIGRLAKKWNEEKVGRRDEYVNIFSKESMAHPIIGDAVRLITPEARRQIADAFEDGEFWVRKDSLDDVIGYRGISIGDFWTGTTTLSPKTQKTMSDVATAVFGKNAYKNLVRAEDVWKNFVGDARVTIVIKSGIVPVANMLSNVLHKLSLGIPPEYIVKGMARKTHETNVYLANELKKNELDAELFNAHARSDLKAIRKIEIQIQSIEDAHRHLSIWPLIEAGEFTSINEAGIHPDDQLLTTGRLNDYLERAADKLPDSIKTAGRYAIISQDTSLFKGLQRATQYGDFLSKAVLYDYLTSVKGKSQEYALGRVTDEFINFDRAPGRARSYLESMGALWFWHFKIRSIKIAMNTLRNNPLQLLLTGMIPMPDLFGSIGSPNSDNLVAVGLKGKLGWSMGPLQAFRAYLLNPGFNMLT